MEKKIPNKARKTFSGGEDEVPEESVSDKVGGLVHKAADAVKGAFSHHDKPQDEAAPEEKKSVEKKSSGEKKSVHSHKRYDKFKKGNS